MSSLIESGEISAEEFVGELHTMDLSELLDKTFVVALNTGDRNEHRFLCSTICGPYDFLDMVGMVDQIWKQELIHAKVYILEKGLKGRKKFLEQNVVDYIEAKSGDIIIEALMQDAADKEYTCKASLIEAADEKKPKAEPEV
jgi:hypothetical protein